MVKKFSLSNEYTTLFNKMVWGFLEYEGQGEAFDAFNDLKELLASASEEEKIAINDRIHSLLEKKLQSIPSNEPDLDEANYDLVIALGMELQFKSPTWIPLVVEGFFKYQEDVDFPDYCREGLTKMENLDRIHVKKLRIV